MYESKPRLREGEPIESIVGEAIELTASRSGGAAAEAGEGEPGAGAGEKRGSRSFAGGAAGALAGGTGSGRTLPWDGWGEDRLRVAFLAAAAFAAMEALVLLVVLMAAVFS